MRIWRRIFASCCSVAVVACGSDVEQSPEIPDTSLSVRSAWARAADSGAMTALYFTLANDGTLADTLLEVRSDDAALSDMHVSTQRDGMMRMSPVTALPIPATDSVSFRPLGAHVMLTGLVRPLVPGDTVTATLRFVSGASVTVRAGVRAP